MKLYRSESKQQTPSHHIHKTQRLTDSDLRSPDVIDPWLQNPIPIVWDLFQPDLIVSAQQEREICVINWGGSEAGAVGEGNRSEREIEKIEMKINKLEKTKNKVMIFISKRSTNTVKYS